MWDQGSGVSTILKVQRPSQKSQYQVSVQVQWFVPRDWDRVGEYSTAWEPALKTQAFSVVVFSVSRAGMR